LLNRGNRFRRHAYIVVRNGRQMLLTRDKRARADYELNPRELASGRCGAACSGNA
jgi:hypothetical protein